MDGERGGSPSAEDGAKLPSAHGGTNPSVLLGRAGPSIHLVKGV